MKFCASFLCLGLAACGNSAVDGDLTGQAKKVTHVTPLFCPGYVAFDVSLGVMQNGTGSMSTQDVWFTVSDSIDVDKLKSAVADAMIVRVHFDTRRLPFCTENYIMRGFELSAAK